MSDTVDKQVLLENMQVAIILIDHNQFVRTVNIATETLFEQSRRYLLGKHLRELIPLKAVLNCVSDCFKHSSQYTLREIELDLFGRHVLMDLTVSSINYAMSEQASVLIEINSIDRISRFMKENNQLERQQSFRLMMRGLAHEIKNPLSGIRGAAQLLDREISEPNHTELTRILIKEADRLTRLVDRVMGSREQLKPTAINIHEVLEHVVGLVNSRNHLVIERLYDPTLPEIYLDKEQLIQAILNIVNNAIEAQVDSDNPKIGLITHFERFVTINQEMHRQALKIKIWDDGPGVLPEMREIIFDPLITGRPQGTGLGLSLTQEIVQRHKGMVLLEDHAGKTCFSIYLPYIQADNHL